MLSGKLFPPGKLISIEAYQKFVYTTPTHEVVYCYFSLYLLY